MNKDKISNIIDKIYLTMYIILNLLVFFSLIKELFNWNFKNILLCLLTLIIFNSLKYIEELFKIRLSSTFKILILLFVFFSEIIGQVYNFYGLSSIFDKFVHILNGFLCASVGFYLVFLLNNIHSNKNIILKLFISFCFSMTISVFWEFYEYGIEKIFKLDMQRDQYVYNISSTFLDTNKKKNEVKIDDIYYVVLYDSNNIELKKLDGYLDIGLNDTMQDLIGNAIGSILFCVLGYFYVIDKNKYKFIKFFLITKTKSC